jgi:hypothetical protein
LIQINFNDQFAAKPKDIPGAFANNFKSIFNTSCPTVKGKLSRYTP